MEYQNISNTALIHTNAAYHIYSMMEQAYASNMLINLESEDISAYHYLTLNQWVSHAMIRSYYCTSKSRTGEEVSSWPILIGRNYDRFTS